MCTICVPQNRAPSPLETAQTLHLSPDGESEDDQDPSPRPAEPRFQSEESEEKARIADRAPFVSASTAETNNNHIRR